MLCKFLEVLSNLGKPEVAVIYICKISGHFEEIVGAPPRALEGARVIVGPLGVFSPNETFPDHHHHQ